MAIVVCAAALGMGSANAQQPAAPPSEQPATQPPGQPAAQSPEQPAEQPAAKIPSEVCLGCHGVEGFAVPGANGQMRSLHIDAHKFLNSVHGKTPCVGCHQQITQVPHQKLDHIEVGCVTCHQDLYDDALSDNNREQIAALGMVVQRIDSFMKTIHAQPNGKTNPAPMPPATIVTTLITPIRQAPRSGRSGASAFPPGAASATPRSWLNMPPRFTAGRPCSITIRRRRSARIATPAIISLPRPCPRPCSSSPRTAAVATKRI